MLTKMNISSLKEEKKSNMEQKEEKLAPKEIIQKSAKDQEKE